MFSKKKFNSDDEVINLFTRSDMLKHEAFHQLQHNNLRKPVSPHSIHKDLREKIGTLLSILLKKNSAINSIVNETSEDSTALTKTAS